MEGIPVSPVLFWRRSAPVRLPYISLWYFHLSFFQSLSEPTVPHTARPSEAFLNNDLQNNILLQFIFKIFRSVLIWLYVAPPLCEGHGPVAGHRGLGVRRGAAVLSPRTPHHQWKSVDLGTPQWSAFFGLQIFAQFDVSIFLLCIIFVFVGEAKIFHGAVFLPCRNKNTKKCLARVQGLDLTGLFPQAGRVLTGHWFVGRGSLRRADKDPPVSPIQGPVVPGFF